MKVERCFNLKENLKSENWKPVIDLIEKGKEEGEKEKTKKGKESGEKAI